jgi:uncharacterized protein YukJ
MAIVYGFAKCKVGSEPKLRKSERYGEVEYHLVVTLEVPTADGTQPWQGQINVGSESAGDALKYRLVNTYQNAILDTLAGTAAGFTNLTGQQSPPALDFLRSDILANTGSWTEPGTMDGSADPQPIPSVISLLEAASQEQADVYVFGHMFDDNGIGMHDIHMNQGSTGTLLNNRQDANKDHNEIWQDGAILVDFGNGSWTGYFTAFAQQLVPTDSLGDPLANAHPITDSDPGSLIGQ